jgi:hypothetical protein
LKISIYPQYVMKNLVKWWYIMNTNTKLIFWLC